MGTRALTIFRERIEDPSTEICVLYRQYDGYPAEHGVELCKYLSELPTKNTRREWAHGHNGIECLAALSVARFKIEPGNFYLHAPGLRDRGEDYLYFVGLDEVWTPQVAVFNTCGGYGDDEPFPEPVPDWALHLNNTGMAEAFEAYDNRLRWQSTRVHDRLTGSANHVQNAINRQWPPSNKKVIDDAMQAVNVAIDARAAEATWAQTTQGKLTSDERGRPAS
jgi:hypothetical protein